MYVNGVTVLNKLFIFDLDGVLVDSKIVHFDSLNKALSEIDSKYIISEQEQRETFEGLSTNQKLKILTREKGLPEHYYDLIWKKKQQYSIEFFSALKSDDELIKSFSELKRRGIKIAVASNSIRLTLETCLKALGIKELIDFYLSNEDVSNPKPSPEMYNKTIDYFGTSYNNTVIFEDSYTGRTSAILSNARVVTVANRKDLTYDKIISEIKLEKKKFNVLIPMAGFGSRFRQAGYDLPKPLIKVKDKSMIQTVVENIGIDAKYIFIARKDDCEKYKIKEHISSFCKDFEIIEQDGPLDGATKSALLASSLIDNDSPLLIANSDQYLIWNSKKVLNDFYLSGIDGGILTFEAHDTKWSFAKKNDNGFVTAVAEKNVISNEATCGLYYWKNGSDFVRYAKRMIDKNIKTNNEFYICPVYNEAIEDEKIILTHKVYEMWGLGTPEDLEEFLEKTL